MKTRFLFRSIHLYMTFSLVFMLATFSANAQCPTIPDPTPTPICDASGFTFGDLNTFATDQGNGIVWYNTSTGGSPFNINQLVNEGTFYADDNSGTCGTRYSITIDFVVNPSGQNLNGIYCSNKNPTIQTYIDEVLQPNVPVGGNVSVFNDLELTSQASVTDPLPLGATNYFVVFTDLSACESQIEIGTTAVFDAPADPMPANPQEFCSDTNPTIGDLNPGTTESVNWYANIDGNGDPVLPALSLSTPLINGGTYYVQTNSIFCDSNAVPVSVNISDPVDAGTSGSLEFCENSVPTNDFNLFDELLGTPNTTGIWTGPIATTNGHFGTVNISTSTTPNVYSFTYTVPANGICPEAVSTVTITIYDTFTSGIPSAANPATFCEAGLPAAFDLTTLLDSQDLNGQWTQGTTSTDPIVTSPIDLTGFTPGTYNFTYTQNISPNPCPEESTTVQVIVLQNPNVGNAVNETFCENVLAANSPYDLFDALDGTEDAGGEWTDAEGTVVTNLIDVTGFETTGSPYNYTYTVDNGTCSDSETISIIIESSPTAGTVNEAPDFCVAEITTGQTVNLFDYLDNAVQAGTWSDNTPSNQLTGNTLTIDGLASGTYTFTFDVDAIGTCDDPNMPTVTVTINDTPTATANAMQPFCDAAIVADLSATGTTIQWYDEAIGGLALVGTTALINGETYYATQTDATTGCESATRVEVTVTIIPLPNAGGLAATPIIACNNTTVDLNSGLDGTQDITGIWYEGTDDTGVVVVNPSMYDITGFAIGDYQFTYVVSAAPCADASTTITVTVQAPIDAGINVVLDICNFDDGTTYNLFAQLGGTPDAGGSWVPELASTTDVFDPSVDVAGTYTYFLTNSCGNATSEVAVSVTDTPDAGTDGEFIICVVDINTTNNMLDLLTVLNDTPDTIGTFTNDDGATGFTGTMLDLSMVTLGTPYNFTYTVTATAPCTINASAIATVTVNDTASVTVNNATPQFCAVDSPTIADLDTFITGTAIVWYEDATATTPLNVTEALIDGEDYFATQTSANNCESSTRELVTVTVGDAPTPTLIDANLELCINDAPKIAELTANISEYIATTNNVAWYDAETNGSTISSTTELTAYTTYYATLIDPVSGCESSVRLAITPDLSGCDLVTIPDGFSPNGDGVNDTFNVDNLDIIYPNFKMEIFNRYGNVVYKGNASTPSFDGTSNQSRSIGSGELPVGVYYYIFNFNDGKNKPKQGSLYLSR